MVRYHPWVGYDSLWYCWNGKSIYNMIQKRFQYWSAQGKTWTDWFDYREDNGQLRDLQVNEKWQVKNKLLNQYRII